MKSIPFIITALLLLLPAAAAPERPDALYEALALAGLERGDLGWEPKGWWPRYPDVPYKMRAFDALFREPLDLVPYTRLYGETVREKLDPGFVQLLDNVRRALDPAGIMSPRAWRVER